MIAGPATLVTKSAQSAQESVWERLRARWERARRAFQLRLDDAVAAFEAERAWQEANGSRPVSDLGIESATLAGLAIEVTTGSYEPLHPGVQTFDGRSVHVENGQVYWLDPQLGMQVRWSNDFLDTGEKRYLLKLFPADRLSLRKQVKGAQS